MLWFIVFAIIELNHNFNHGQTICNAVNFFKLLLLTVNMLLQSFHHWLPQSQAKAIGSALPPTWWDNHHHLSSTGNILPCWFRNLNRNHLRLPLRFQRHPQSTHDVYTHHMNSTWTLSILSRKNISRQYCRGQNVHLLICICYWTFSPTMKCFRKSLTSMCFGISCYHKCTAYDIWWNCRKDGRLIAYRIWKETFIHRYRCLSHLTFPIHLSVATTNTAFVYVFSPLESLMWSGYYFQGWWKRNLADPWHSPIKQTKFRLHVFL